ncbi:MAG TPA: hypothetical protein VE643_09010 [Nitrososphaeraceae archaeon]|jgi:hypothetical protein|nr:hypothetical protein [Nitrososphaeraceae archaeon]
MHEALEKQLVLSSLLTGERNVASSVYNNWWYAEKIGQWVDGVIKTKS